MSAEDPYARIDRGYRAMVRGEPFDSTALAAMLRDIGLFSPAAELEGASPDSDTTNDCVPAEETQRLIARQLDVLSARGDCPADWLMVLRGLASHITVHRCSEGYAHPSIAGPDGVRRWLPGFARRRLDAALDAQLRGLAPHRVLVIGLSEPIAAALHAITAVPDMQAQRTLYLCDPEPLHWLAWLASGDHSAVLVDPRCMMLHGPDPAAIYRRLLESRPDLPPHSAVVDTLQRADLKSALQQVIAGVQAERTALRTNRVELLRSRDAARSDAECGNRLKPGATVIGVVSRFTTVVRYSMRDMARAFESLGYRFRIIEEASAHEPHTGESIMGVLLEEDPVLIVLINHLRSEYGGMFSSVPMVTWVQDPVDTILAPGRAETCGPRDFLVGFYHERCTKELGYSAERFLALPSFPVCSHVFHDAAVEEASAPESDPLDLVYVGHLHATPEELVATTRAREQGAGIRLIDGIDEAVAATLRAGRAMSIAGAEMLVESVASSLGGRLEPDVLGSVARNFAYRLYDVRLRIESLTWAARWAERRGRRFAVHGLGWERVEAIRPFARAPLSHGEALRRRYRTATLTLQTIPTGFNHQRTWEALLSGALPLVRAVPADFAGLSRSEFRAKWGTGEGCPRLPYTNGFRNLDELVFESEEEFASRAEHWLLDHAARAARRQHDAEIVRDRLTYDRHVPEIIEMIRRRLSASPQ